MTLREFVARVRVEITKHVLRDTDMKIEAIADLVGFHDASHLSIQIGHHEHIGSPGDGRLDALDLCCFFGNRVVEGERAIPGGRR